MEGMGIHNKWGMKKGEKGKGLLSE